MLVLVPTILYLLFSALRALFTTVPLPSNSPEALRGSNLSQALIDELLTHYVSDSVIKYDTAPSEGTSINQLPSSEEKTPRTGDKIRGTPLPTVYPSHSLSTASLLLSVDETTNQTADHGGGTTNSSSRNTGDDKSPKEGSSMERPMGDAPHTRSPDDLPSRSGDLFSQPPQRLEPDWDVVLGTYDHYDDENWENFLIQSEVPLFIRRLLGWSSETLYIKKDVLREPGDDPQNFQMQITTDNWLITHQSRFHLRRPYTESDLDGTDSENTFYFLTPRTLVQNKFKERWHMYLFRQFDEQGCIMTIVDRKRKLAARRYYKRVLDTTPSPNT